MSRSGYIKVERQERKLSVDRLAKAAAIYQVAQSTIVSEETATKVVGFVELGGIVRFEDVQSSPVKLIAPPDGAVTAKALEVRGGALPGVADDHWLVFYDDVLPGMPDDRVGELCVIAVDGGAAIRIGRVYRGEKPDRFDVVPPGYARVRDVEIEWSALVTWIKPR